MTMQSSKRHNLPLQPTPLIGREQEIATARDLLLSGQTRLLTLVGPGGIGKTRLALAIAEALHDAMPDGAWFVDLAPISDPTLVISAMAQALRVRETGESPLLEGLNAYLCERRLLLLLDNFEQVLSATPQVADLLAGCPGLTMLVTSRERLRLRWEQALPVMPLATPNLGRATDPGALVRVASVALFVERARAVDPAFALTADNAPAVARLCARLDGLPLAIELAAAWANVLAPLQILARLEQRQPLLHRGSRDLPDRHHTLQAAIGWSYDLLPTDEQGLFRRIGVFVGGWTLAAAEAVAASGEPGLDILDGLTALAEKSLVHVVQHTPDGPRFGMVETVREYALEQLAATGEQQATQRVHAAWCLALAQQADREMWGPRHGRWPGQLAAEYDNIRAALTWMRDQGEIERGLGLTSALWKFFRSGGYPSEARQWQRQLLTAAADLPSRARIDGLWLAGDLAGLAGDYQAAATLLEQGLHLAREAGDRLAIAKALYLLGNVAEDLDDSEREVALYEEALGLFREVGDHWWIAFTVSSLGRAARKRGDYARARALQEEALGLHRDQGNTWGEAWVLTALGELASDEGTAERAATHFRESVRLHVDHGEHLGIMFCLLGLGKLAAAGGRPEAAARLLGAAEALRESRGWSLPQDHRDPHDRSVARIRAELGDEAFATTWAMGPGLPLEQVVEEATALAAGLAIAPPTPLAPAVTFGLSGRESEVLRLMAEGLSNQQIADQLVISERTARFHVTSIFNKLGADNRAQAVALAAQQGLL